jgi:integrase
MNVYRIRQSPYWYADLRPEGLGRFSTGIRDRRKAELTIYRYLLAQGKTPSTGTLSQLITRYKTVTQIRKTPKGHARDCHTLELFRDRAGDLVLVDIGPERIEAFIQWRSQTVSAATVNRDLNVLRSLFHRAVEWGLIPSSPLRHIKRIKGAGAQLPRYFTPGQIERILAASPPEYRRIWRILLYSGFRRGELMGLHWQDIRDGHIIVRKPKEGREKIIPVSRRLGAVLAELPRKSERVIPGLHEASLSRAFKRILGRLGFEGNLHWLRHTTATLLLLDGIPIHVVSRLLGHASLRTTSWYAHALDSHLRDAVDSLNFDLAEAHK